jgi:cell fate regulator YaaT (PSP1 superfamily)
MDTTQESRAAAENAEETGSILYLIKDPHTNETFTACSDMELSERTPVVLPTRYGTDIGLVLGKLRSEGASPCAQCGAGESGQKKDDGGGDSAERSERGGAKKGRRRRERQSRDEVCTIIRAADEKDLEKYEKNRIRELEALQICREKVKSRRLDMKMVSAHYLLGESKVLFFFTADSRVDFRELVKDLVSVFKMRIELRQIGVRDESRVLGGLAVCGRDYCCHSITDKLNPVSIKMAKEQNLSLNSMKISGPCGRLLCCLSYEYDFYREEKRKMPSEGSRLKVREEMVKITEVNILSKKLYLASADGRLLVVPFDKVHCDEATKKWSIDSEFIEEML